MVDQWLRQFETCVETESFHGRIPWDYWVLSGISEEPFARHVHEIFPSFSIWGKAKKNLYRPMSKAPPFENLKKMSFGSPAMQEPCHYEGQMVGLDARRK